MNGNQSHMRLGGHRYLLGLSLAGLLTFFGWPTTTPQTPAWEVWVMDEAGKPIENITVRLTYQDYSAESEGHTEDLKTDAKGYVFFPARTLRIPRIERALAIARSATAGVHASFGPHAWVWAFGQGLEGVALDNGHITDWTGKPARMKSTVVAKHGEAVIRTY